jgi:hypothetical protein
MHINLKCTSVFFCKHFEKHINLKCTLVLFCAHFEKAYIFEVHFSALLCTKSTYCVEMCNYYIVHCACFVQDLRDDDMRIPADEPAPHFKKPRFTRTETEINSTYVNSHMSLREGDDLLHWACNEARKLSDVRYQSMRKLTWGDQDVLCSLWSQKQKFP